MKIKFLESCFTDPYVNLALEEYLTICASETDIILFLWQNDNTIVVGRNQNVFVECKLEAFIKDNGHVCRRKSGGGAVFHDLGNLNFSIITGKKNDFTYKNLLTSVLGNKIDGLWFNNRNDALIGDRKISGNAVYTKGHIQCQHGTVLVNTDIERMICYLTPNYDKLARNHIQSIASRVMNLEDVMDVNTTQLKKLMISSMDAEPFEWDFNKTEILNLISQYRSIEWVLTGKDKQEDLL